MRRLHRRPSPALLVAFLALLVATGGTAVAANLISGRSIRRNSIPADRIKRNSLGGGRIAERLLGKVPRAKRADVAGAAFGAVNSQRVGNLVVAKVLWRVRRRTGDQLIADVNGLQLYASCSRAGVASVRAVTTVPNTQVQLGAELPGVNRSSSAKNGDFDPGESVDLDRNVGYATGTLTYIRPGGVMAVLPYGVSGGGLCRFAGTLTSG